MEVVTMKKFLVLAVALLVSSSAWAVTTTVKNTIVATAQFAGEASFTFTLKTVENDLAAEALDWGADAFVMGGTTTWVAANQYAEVYAKVTKAGYAVYMNTDNKSAFGNNLPANQDGSVGGLVRVNADGTLGSQFNGDYRGYIPVIFSYVAEKGLPTLNITNVNTGAVKETVTNDQSDRYLSDVGSTGFNKNYTTIAALNGPTFFTSENKGTEAAPNWVDCQYPSTSVQNNTAYMYFFGGFKNIIGGDKYTTTIKVTEEVE